MHPRVRSFALACALGTAFGASSDGVVSGQERAGRPAIPAEVRFAGLPLTDALRELGRHGLSVLFTAELVRPEMRVIDEPRAREPRALLDALLAPHGLAVSEAPGGVMVVVARATALRRGGSIEGDVRANGGVGSELGAARVHASGEGELEATTAADGRFAFPDLLPGRYTVEATAEGFLSQRVEVAVEAGGRRRVVFELQPLPFVEEEIVVRPSRLSLLEEQPASAFSMSRDDVDRLPHLGGDALRTASLLPGITANDVTAQPSVHGGRRDEVKVLLDGQELYQAFHLADYDNALAMVPASALEGVTISTGAYAVSQGDRMSGVLDLRTQLIGTQRHYLLSASVVDMVASAGGTWSETVGGGWFASGRRGTTELAREVLGEEDPGFWDLLGKAEVATPAGRLAARVLLAGDELELDKPEGDDFELLENDYESRYVWLTHEATPADRILVETSASEASVRRDRAGTSSEEKGDFDVDDRRDLEVAGLTQAWTFDLGGRNVLRGGWEARRYESFFDYAKQADREFSILAPFSPPRPDDHAFEGLLRGDHAAVWVSDRWRLFGQLSAEVGLRWDRHEATDDTLSSPRVSLGWRLGSTSVLRASWGRFFQSHRPYELQVEDAEPALFTAERSEHTVVGYEAIFARRGAGLQGVRVELFHRDIANPRPRYENLLQPIEFLPEVEPDRVRITPQSSRSQGVELLIRARAGARLDGWLAYSHARAEDRIDGDDVPRSLDQPHTGTLGLDFHPTARTSIALGWRYRSGWPTTPLLSIAIPDPDDPEEIEHQLVFGRLNSERFGVYHRLDLRASRRVAIARGSLLLFLDVQNLYNRANDAGFDVGIDEDTGEVLRDREAWPGIFPSIGVTWER